MKSNKILFFTSTILCFSFASNQLQQQDFLSKDREDIFDLSKKQNIQNSNKLKKDWINPIILKYKKNLGQKDKSSHLLINIDQAIFQSGGIYQAIKYASSTFDYANLDIEQQRKLLIKKAVNLLYNIEKTTLNIKKQKFQIENAKIDVKRKKEQVLNGFLDSSYLDNALLTLNNSKTLLVDLKYKKKSLINSFDSISSKKYDTFSLPKFELISKDKFIQENLELKKAKVDTKRKKEFSYMTKARYLPSVNVYYNYSKYYNSDTISKESQQNYGLSLTIPLDSRTFDDIESKKIDYLKSKLNIKNSISEQNSFFDTKLDEYTMLDEKRAITKESLELYKSILKTINEEKEAGLKTISDIQTLQNSQNIKKLDLELFNIEKQLLLLEIYAKLL